MRKPYNGNLTITSEFGNRRFQLWDGSWYSDFHNGIDIGGIFPVLTAQAGRVVAVATNGVDRGGELVSGTPANYVILDHGNGLRTLYWHLGEVKVSIGQYVEEGQQIGVSGRTGEATGFHLHFMVQVNGVNQNPRNYVDFNADYSNSNVNTTPMNQERRVYTVVGGDYLEGIALKLYGDKNRIYDLISWNSIQNKDLIFVGQQIVYYIDAPAPVPAPTPNTDKIKEELKAQFEKEKQGLEIKYQQQIAEENEKDKKERDELLKKYNELDEKYQKGELDSRAEIAGLEVRIQELTDQIKARQEIKLEIAGLDVNQLGLHVAQLAIEQYGVKAKYHSLIDRIFPSEGKLDVFMRGLLKFDWAWILFFVASALVSVTTYLQNLLSPDQKIALLALSVLAGFLGTVVKFLFTNVDKNKDGKIDIYDSVTLSGFAKQQE